MQSKQYTEVEMGITDEERKKYKYNKSEE